MVSGPGSSDKRKKKAGQKSIWTGPLRKKYWRFCFTCICIVMNLVLVGPARDKVPVGHRDSPQTVLGHRLNDRGDQPVLVGRGEALNLAPLAHEEAALLHDDLGGALGVDPVAAPLQWDDCAHGLSGRVEGVDLLEPGVRHLASQLQMEGARMNI